MEWFEETNTGQETLFFTHTSLQVRSQKHRPLAGQFEALDDVPSFRTQSLPSCTLCKEKCRYGCLLQWGIPPRNGFRIKSNIFLQFLDSSISRNSYMDLSEKMGVAAKNCNSKRVSVESGCLRQPWRERTSWNNAQHMEKILDLIAAEAARVCHRLNLWLVLCNASPISPPESSSMRWIPLVLAQRTHAFQPADALFC